MAPGDYITLQSLGQIENPHQHSRSDQSPPHVDGWLVENVNGALQAQKIHSDR